MKNKKIIIFLCCLSFKAVDNLQAQVEYPYPINKYSFSTEGKRVQMAYMDISPSNYSPEKNVLLLHGKNFNGYYWKNLIPLLVKNGYRVIVPDQLGWGHSDKPNIHYSFHGLARNTKGLLDSLGIQKVIIIGHSMGGMLATRFTLLYPELVEKLVLEDPIGLEDYRRFVPYRPLDQTYAKEKSATYESYKKYQQSYYPAWKPEYEQYVKAQAEILNDPAFDSIAWVNAFTYHMIVEQPVCYEFDRIVVPTLLIIGELDRTVVGKDLLPENKKNQFGQYPALAGRTQLQMRNAQLVILPGIGHIPHIQDIELFREKLFPFLKQ